MRCGVSEGEPNAQLWLGTGPLLSGAARAGKVKEIKAQSQEKEADTVLHHGRTR